MPIIVITSILFLVLPTLALGYVMWRLRVKGFAPGWKARCTDCGTVIPAGEIPGVIRVHTHRDFKSVAHHTCEKCGESQPFDIEYAPKD